MKKMQNQIFPKNALPPTCETTVLRTLKIESVEDMRQQVDRGNNYGLRLRRQRSKLTKYKKMQSINLA